MILNLLTSGWRQKIMCDTQRRESQKWKKWKEMLIINYSDPCVMGPHKTVHNVKLDQINTAAAQIHDMIWFDEAIWCLNRENTIEKWRSFCKTSQMRFDTAMRVVVPLFVVFCIWRCFRGLQKVLDCSQTSSAPRLLLWSSFSETFIFGWDSKLCSGSFPESVQWCQSPIHP